jgi:hypothetical protein
MMSRSTKSWNNKTNTARTDDDKNGLRRTPDARLHAGQMASPIGVAVSTA